MRNPGKHLERAAVVYGTKPLRLVGGQWSVKLTGGYWHQEARDD